MTIAQAGLDESAVAVMPQNFGTIAILFFAMILAAAAMIIPGISGSFVALALGAYPTVIEAISTFNIILLIPIGLGVVMGLVGGAGLIRFLLDRFPRATYSAILGLLVGSMISLLYPLVPQMSWNLELVIGIAVAAGGFVLAYLFCKSEAKEK